MPLPRRLVATTALVMLAAGTTVATGGPVLAHEGIKSSDPASGTTVEEPISSVTIDFGAEIGKNTELGLIAPDGTELASTTTVTSDTTAEITFDPVSDEGTYLVNYLAPSVVDGHLIVGAISFNYGSASIATPGPAILPWVLFGIAAVVILGIGAWLSLQRHRQERAPA